MTTFCPEKPASGLQSLLKVSALAAVAAISLFATAPSANAGTSVLKALQAALLAQNPSVADIKTATSQELFDAFVTVLTDPKFNTTKKQGIVAGEALKAAGPNATNAGEFFGQQIIAGIANPPFDGIFLDRRNFLALAATTAGAGKGLNVTQIPGLASEIIPSETGVTFAAVAQATKGKPAIGAIFGGRARQIFANDPTPALTSTVVANSAIFDKKLAAAAQDITQWIAAEFAANGADSASFAIGVADGNASANNNLATKIITGAAAGDPTNAGNIVHNVFNQQLLQPNGTLAAPTLAPSANLLTTAIKGASSMAKTVSAVADIEEIQKVGNALGLLIGTPNPTKPTVGLLKLSQAAGFIKTLATAVMNKPRTNSFGATIAANADPNKRDEIAEVAAYMVGGLINSPELAALGADAKKAASAASKILSMITAAAGVKPKVVSKVAQGPTSDTFAADVAASVAWTVENSTLPQSIKDALETLLKNPKTAAKINKTAAAQVATAITDVYNGTNTGRFEDGNVVMDAVSDPETDKHPFS